ncbi:poly-beta-1,6-N-acetyl-D-glucosamine biosynthesis protein PgaD [Lysobacter antibioticus]|uniref:Poly-beta-1,6-N-acetyl-D-glucosamine biosynthesis protein PgaD n=1 Tax=Lysobacter antibioticus TaxID=84531 RepID=A0A0S2FD23_LYSAN|nr:poly-beta-1,6-N-acetyl-D-glucosamine biosynthesis protein PgaD [Lysobacter antibioticus]ALN81379.1 poly-beta-1,6-N-acetyl-D-glucosamine biosynthesis protein PgaD [Lysobacter antibioticus]
MNAHLSPAAPKHADQHRTSRKRVDHKHDSRLIQKPGAQDAWPRTLWGVVTGAFWLAYLYLWIPVATLVLWLFGIRRTASELYLREHGVDPFLMLVLPATAAVVVALLLIWAEYNRWRFAASKGDRRGAQPTVGLDEIADHLGASAEVAQALNQGRISVLHMDPNHAVPLSLTAVTPPAISQPFPPVAPMPRFARDMTPQGSWILMIALAISVAIVVGVLAVVSFGYRQIQSVAPKRTIEGTPGLDRPAFLPEDADPALAPVAIGRATAVGIEAAVRDARQLRDTDATRRDTVRPRRNADVLAPNAKPRPLPGHSPKPPYPIDALRRGEGGLVTLRVQVSAEGRPLKVDVSKRSSNRELDRAAVRTVRTWRFAPAVRRGKAIAAVVIVPVEFKPDR